MGLKRVTTKEGEVYFIDEKNGERVITGLEVGKTEQGTGNGEQENKNLSMDKTIKYIYSGGAIWCLLVLYSLLLEIVIVLNEPSRDQHPAAIAGATTGLLIIPMLIAGIHRKKTKKPSTKGMFVLYFVIVTFEFIASMSFIMQVNSYLQEKNTAKEYVLNGNAKYNLADYGGAIKECDRALEIDPNNTEAYNNRGLAKYELEDYEGAIQDYTKVIEIDPYNALAYYNRGGSKYRLSNFEGAIKDCDRAIEINPNYAAAYINRGVAKVRLGDKNGACSDWSKAGELGNDQAYELIKKFCND